MSCNHKTAGWIGQNEKPGYPNVEWCQRCGAVNLWREVSGDFLPRWKYTKEKAKRSKVAERQIDRANKFIASMDKPDKPSTEADLTVYLEQALTRIECLLFCIQKEKP